jgi:hypothetical protein
LDPGRCLVLLITLPILLVGNLLLLVRGYSLAPAQPWLDGPVGEDHAGSFSAGA